MSQRTSGRPRKNQSLTGCGTREDILAASAQLFCAKGFGGTSTHEIAATAGIRQASIYHHFPSKQSILLELLIGTVQPSLEAAKKLATLHEVPAAARLWALCVSDARLLAAGSQNIGALYLLPELEDPVFADFLRERAELEALYSGLIRWMDLTVEDAQEGAALVLALVENVILLRRRQPAVDFSQRAESIAAAALRMLGLESQQVEAAVEQGTELLSQLA